MSDDERQDWLRMRAILEEYLIEVDKELLLYSIRGDDEKHNFLVKKAIQYRNTITQISELLTQ